VAEAPFSNHQGEDAAAYIGQVEPAKGLCLPCRAVPWGGSGGGEGRCVSAERCVTPCTELTWDGVDGFIRRTTCGELVRSPWNPLAYAASYTDFASAASIVRRSPAAVALAGWPGGSSGGIRRAVEP
jgi:hypothetical protein